MTPPLRTIVNVDVPDLERAIAFYRNAVGLELSRVIDGDVAELVGGSIVFYLLEKPARSRTSERGDQRRDYDARHWTPVHIDFGVADVEQAASRALQAGAVRESDTVVFRGSKCITFSDPFGHGFCLIEFENGTYSSD